MIPELPKAIASGLLINLGEAMDAYFANSTALYGPSSTQSLLLVRFFHKQKKPSLRKILDFFECCEPIENRDLAIERSIGDRTARLASRFTWFSRF